MKHSWAEFFLGMIVSCQTVGKSVEKISAPSEWYISLIEELTEKEFLRKREESIYPIIREKTEIPDVIVFQGVAIIPCTRPFLVIQFKVKSPIISLVD